MEILLLALLTLAFLSVCASAGEARVHVLKIRKEEAYTGKLRSDIPPQLRIDSGDTVVFNTHMLMEGRLRDGMRFEEVAELSREIAEKDGGFYSFTGPFYIREARPGDVVEIRIKRIVPGSYGVTMFFPEGKEGLEIAGLSEGLIMTGHYSADRKNMEFKPGIVLPLRPFLGTMALAPRPGEEYAPVDPGYYAGNMDIKELVAGATLYVPVNVEGGLFMAADAHGLQGDGEVCSTASETWFEEVELEFFVRKDMKLKAPMAETPTHWIVMAFHEDLNLAMKTAIQDTVSFLERTQNLSAAEALALTSLAVDFRVAQFGMNGLKSLYAMIPKGIFQPKK